MQVITMRIPPEMVPLGRIDPRTATDLFIEGLAFHLGERVRNAIQNPLLLDSTSILELATEYARGNHVVFITLHTEVAADQKPKIVEG
jgi:hypothetical protein